MAAIAVLAFSGCNKEPEPATDTTPATSLTLSFRNMVDADPLVIGGPNHYVNALGDSFYVTTYNYYVTNIKLTDASGNTWAEPESYHLVLATQPSTLSFTMHGMPEANYTSIEYMIGVDSTRNVSGAQTGDLDPIKGMFWTWNTGYIMAKFEGKSPSSTAPSNNLVFHVGGYGGNRATQRVVSPSFNSLTANVSTSVTPVIHIDCNVNEWFRTPTAIDFSTTNNVASSGPAAMTIADNYSDMFTVTGIDN